MPACPALPCNIFTPLSLFVFRLTEVATQTPKGDFTGVNLDFTGCGHASKSIQGIIMAKNGSFQMDIHGGGDSDSGILGDVSVTNDLINFFDHMTYWREIRE